MAKFNKLQDAREFLRERYPDRSIKVEQTCWVHPYPDRATRTTEFGVGVAFPNSQFTSVAGDTLEEAVDALIAEMDSINGQADSELPRMVGEGDVVT